MAASKPPPLNQDAIRDDGRLCASWLERAETQALFQSFADAHHRVRVVGGAIRNTLLGEAVTDIDLATTATPQDALHTAEAAGFTAIATGLKHGTITVVINGVSFEVTTLRQDIATDGRHAQVAFTKDWEIDAARRDFTINALYCDLDGTLYDPLGGLDDLKAGRIRFIGNPTERIQEDYLRILRLYRFYARYPGFDLELQDRKAAIQARAGLKRLSAERIHQELMKLLSAPNTGKALEMMSCDGLLSYLLGCAPNVPLCNRLIALTEETTIGASRDRDDRTARTALRLAGLAVTVAEDAARLTQRLRLSRIESDVLKQFATFYTRATVPPTPQEQKQFLYWHGRAAYQVWLLSIWAQASCSSRIASSDPAFGQALRLPDQWHPPQFPLRGADAIALGLPPGPDIGRILSKLEAEWVHNAFRADRAQLLEKLRGGIV